MMSIQSQFESEFQCVDFFFFVPFLPNAKFANYPTKSLIPLKKSKYNIRAHFTGRLRINPTNKDARHN